MNAPVFQVPPKAQRLRVVRVDPWFREVPAAPAQTTSGRTNVAGVAVKVTEPDAGARIRVAPVTVVCPAAVGVKETEPRSTTVFPPRFQEADGLWVKVPATVRLLAKVRVPPAAVTAAKGVVTLVMDRVVVFGPLKKTGSELATNDPKATIVLLAPGVVKLMLPELFPVIVAPVAVKDAFTVNVPAPAVNDPVAGFRT